jgi:diguanylate cyclase (GGDEF)-like protein
MNSTALKPRIPRIVLAESAIDNVVKCASVLREDGCMAVVAHDELELSNALRDHAPDLVVVDSRRASLALLKTAARPPAFVAVADVGDHEGMLRAIEAGALDIVSRPVEPHMLALRVRMALRSAAMSCELEHLRAKVASSSTPAKAVEVRAATPAAAPANPDELLDRQHFLTRVSGALDQADKARGKLAVLFIDVCGVKSAVTSLPHRDAQELSTTIARRIREGIRERDVLAEVGSRHEAVTIAQLGGDEFTVLVTNLGRVEDAAKIGARIIELISRPLSFASREICVSAEVGVACFPDDHHDAEELLRRAETAAYCARQERYGAVKFYVPTMDSRAFERLTLESNLRRALERNELTLYYQPRVNIRTNRIVGVEALVRWKHPELGFISPAQFIPLAEDTGLIVPIGEWVLREACRQNREWQDRGLAPIRMAVNLSSVQFRQSTLDEVVRTALVDTGLEAQWLELELTESTLMRDSATAVETLERLKGAGIHLSIDDFGTGYSSLAYLKRFPIDALKIDRSFIRDATSNPDDAAIVTAIILMARSLKLNVVAEGVETQSQLEFLRVMQCGEVQGYLFSPPVPPADAARLIVENQSAQAAA